jgi:hypothetical protein
MPKLVRMKDAGELPSGPLKPRSFSQEILVL